MTVSNDLKNQSNRLQSRRPRVLFVGIGDPWTQAAGYLQRQMMWLQVLDQFADVTAALFDVMRPKECPFEMRIVQLEWPVSRSWKHLPLVWRDMSSRLPRRISAYDVSPPQLAVDALEPASYDAVFSYRIDVAYVAGVLKQPFLLLDVDDPEYIRRMFFCLRSKKSIDFRTRRDLKKLKRFEIQSALRAKEAYFCQQKDMVDFADSHCYLAPNTVEVPRQFPERQIQNNILLYVGNFQGGTDSPNVDGLKWLVEKIWPCIRVQQPNAKLLVVGLIGPLAESMLCNQPGVTKLGFVDDLKAIIRTASVALAPIRFGTGTRIKILDAFCAGCPVVSTTIGAEGLGAVDNEHILLADDTRSFAQACIDLMEKPQVAGRIGRAGWQWAFENFGRDVWISKLAAHLEEKISSLHRNCSEL